MPRADSYCAFRRTLGSTLALVVTLAACQPLPGGPEPRPSGRGDGPRATGGTPGPAATEKPSPTGTGAPTPAATATQPVGLPMPGATTRLADASLLRKPSAESATLKGTLRLDAGYLVAARAGNVMSHNGGLIVAAGGGNIMSHNGGLVLSPNGSQIVAAGAGNVISHNGGVMVAAGAGNLVAAGAGNLVAAGAGNYRLAQVGDAAAHALVPAAAVEIGVWSMSERGFLPVGVDGAGKPVYTVYTNLSGAYEVYIPPQESENVLVLAVVKRDDPDPRLAFSLMAPATDGDVREFTEDTAIATTFLREAFATRLRETFKLTDYLGFVQRVGGSLISGKDSQANAVAARIADLSTEAKRLGLDQPENADKAQRAALRAADHVLHSLAIESLTMARLEKRHFNATTEPVTLPADDTPMKVLTELISRARVAAATKLAADPNFFARQAYMIQINERRSREKPPQPAFEVRRPSDVGTLLIEEYLRVTDSARLESLCEPRDLADNLDAALFRALRTLMRNLEILEPGKYGKHDEVDRINVAIDNILQRILLHMLLLGPEETKKIKARLAEPAA